MTLNTSSHPYEYGRYGYPFPYISKEVLKLLVYLPSHNFLQIQSDHSSISSSTHGMSARTLPTRS